MDKSPGGWDIIRLMTTRDVIAANVRARMAWVGMTYKELQLAMGWSRGTAHNKLHGITGMTAEEIERVAAHLGAEPGALFEIPEGFANSMKQKDYSMAA